MNNGLFLRVSRAPLWAVAAGVRACRRGRHLAARTVRATRSAPTLSVPRLPPGETPRFYTGEDAGCYMVAPPKTSFLTPGFLIAKAACHQYERCHRLDLWLKARTSVRAQNQRNRFHAAGASPFVLFVRCSHLCFSPVWKAVCGWRVWARVVCGARLAAGD
jgi:hypothetical protein